MRNHRYTIAAIASAADDLAYMIDTPDTQPDAILLQLGRLAGAIGAIDAEAEQHILEFARDQRWRHASPAFAAIHSLLTTMLNSEAIPE